MCDRDNTKSKCNIYCQVLYCTLFADTEKVLINKTELDNVLYKNTKALRTIGLEALIELHAQLTRAVNAYAKERDRMQLPNELNTIVGRYLHQLATCKK